MQEWYQPMQYLQAGAVQSRLTVFVRQCFTFIIQVSCTEYNVHFL